MKISVVFSILYPDASETQWGAVVVSETVLSKIRTLCQQFSFRFTLCAAGRFQIEAGVPSAGVDQIFCLLSDEGYTPVFARFASLGNDAIRVELQRSYSRVDMESSEYFRMEWWTLLYSPLRMDGEYWIADAEQNSGCPWSYCMNGRLGKHSYFVRKEIERRIITAGFDVDFHGLEAPNGSLEVESSQLIPRYRTPRSLLQVIDGFYIDEAFRVAELQFNRQDFFHIKGVDIALALEDISNGERLAGKHTVIVSRKFREFCLHEGLIFSATPIFLTDAKEYVPRTEGLMLERWLLQSSKYFENRSNA